MFLFHFQIKSSFVHQSKTWDLVSFLHSIKQLIQKNPNI
jgi:hypothetical protein